jgi:thioredoxin-related protein
MKKLLLIFSLIITAGCTQAQMLGTATTIPPTIPPYHILTTDSVYVTPADLPRNKAVMIIYFAPDCSHCHHLINEMKPKMKNFKDVQIVMITFVTQLRAIKDFYRDFQLKKYPNITVGTEGYTYLVQKFYQAKTTPYIALYDKNKKLIRAFDKAPNIDELIEAFKKG